MIKIVELGHEIAQTGEPRVSLLDDRLLKMASNDIQQFWAKLDRAPDKAYLHVIAMTDSHKYGPNNNGDWFDGADLRKYHPTFISNAHIFLHHVNKDPKKSIGKPIYSFYNENMHRVELILEIDKNNRMAQATVEKIKAGEDIFVSMGVSVSHDVCSICGNKAKVRAEYCEHLRYNMKRILPDGRQVYAKNPAPLKFFDISIVSKPADRTAWALDKAASAGGFFSRGELTETSADLGEHYELHQAGLSGLRKLSEMIKKVDGDITEVKEEDNTTNVLRQIKKLQPKHLDYPVMGCEEMDRTGATPGGMLRAIIAQGAPPSLGELAWISGRHHMGSAFRESHIPQMMDMLPGMARLLMLQPSTVFSRIGDILGNYDGELADPQTYGHILRTVRPVTQRRIVLIKQACGEEELQKVAQEVHAALPQHSMETGLAEGSGVRRVLSNMSRRELSPTGPGMFDTYTVDGPDGARYTTNRISAMIAEDAEDIGRLGPALLGGVAGLAALGAALSDIPTLHKFLAVPALGMTALALMSGDKQDRVLSHQGVEIPVGAVFSRANTSGTGKSLTKEAAGTSWIAKASKLIPPPQQKTPTSIMRENNALRNSALMGMAVPIGLGIDYLYNKHIRFKDNPYPEASMGAVGRTAYRLGEKVMETPLTSIAFGGVGGGLTRAAWRGRPIGPR